MTNEELIREFGYNYNGDSIQLEAELLRRLNERDELEKALQEERYDCAIKYAEVYGAELKINELEKELASAQRVVEDLKRFLFWRTEDINPPFRAMPPTVIIDKCINIIKVYEDGLTRKERQGK